jgi:hypothetical protein
MLSVKTFLVVAVASLALGVSSAAQVSSHNAAHASLLDARAATASDAFQEEITVPSSDGLVMTNMGQRRSFTFEGHVLTKASAGGTEGGGLSILYAPSEADDAAYRAAIGAAVGATVDYFDARVATPSVATMNAYDAVHVWANFAFADNVTYGNNLAAYNDVGGTVVMGTFCTYTSGNSLSGTIMTAAYSPVVSPAGTNHFVPSTYSSGGVTCIYTGVTSLTSTFRDFLVVQGTGIEDGFYADSEICHAYRGGTAGAQGDVVYSNGAGAIQLPGGLGDWAVAVGNACTCGINTVSAWTDEGSALAGISGPPSLVGLGSMVFDTTNVLILSNAAPSALSAILASNTSSPTGFKGGTLLPGPTIVSVLVGTDAGGGWSLNFRAPPYGSGTELWVQVAIQDAAAVAGASLSNAVKGTTP